MVRLARFSVVISSILLLIMPVAKVYADIDPNALYVDKDHPQASNSNNGSEDSPWLTIQHGVNQLTAGDTLYVKQSDEPYFEPYRAANNDKGGITIDVQGTADNRIIIAGYPGQRPIIDQQRAQSSLKAEDGTPDSAAKDLAGFYLRFADYITITNFEIRQTSHVGIMMNQGGVNQHIIVEDNHLHHHYGMDNIGGVRLDYCYNCIVRNNLIHDTYNLAGSSNPHTSEPYSLHSGIHGYRPGNCIIENNTIYNVSKGVYEKQPIEDLTQGLTSNTVRNNIFYNITDAAFYVGTMGTSPTPSVDAKFFGNIVYNAKKGVVSHHEDAKQQSSGLKIFNNTFYNIEAEVLTVQSNIGVEIYNNIIAKANFLNIVTVDPDTNFDEYVNELDYLDNNLYFDHPNHWILDRYGLYDEFRSMEAWQSAFSGSQGIGLTSNPDIQSIEGDPMFVDVSRRDFNLLPSSPAINKGREDGNGLRADIGAYGIDTAKGYIGIRPKSPQLTIQ